MVLPTRPYSYPCSDNGRLRLPRAAWAATPHLRAAMAHPAHPAHPALLAAAARHLPAAACHPKFNPHIVMVGRKRQRRWRPLAISPAAEQGGGRQLPPPSLPVGSTASGYVPKLVSPPGRPGGGGGGGSALVQMDPFGFTESCMMKPLMTVPLGFVMGAAFGVFMGSWEGISPPVLLPGVPMPPAKPMVEEFRATGRQMGRKARNWSRNFAVITAIFSGTECVLERIRAEDDMWNSISAGFISGAVLAIKQGPQAMLLGGAGFAAFSYVIDKVTGRH
jgi:import inner membrane translocase subunit TIM22